MSDAILATIISGLLSLAGIIITVVATMRKSRDDMIAEIRRRSDDSDAKLDKEIALIQTKVDELTREVRAHNNFAQRVPVLEEKIKVANHRIDNLESGVHAS